MRHNKLINFLSSFEVNTIMLAFSLGIIMAFRITGYEPFFWSGFISSFISIIGIVGARETERRNGR